MKEQKPKFTEAEQARMVKDARMAHGSLTGTPFWDDFIQTLDAIDAEKARVEPRPKRD